MLKLMANAVFGAWLVATVVWLSLLMYNGWNRPIDRIIERSLPSCGINNGDWLVLYVIVFSGYLACLSVFYLCMNGTNRRMVGVVSMSIFSALVWLGLLVGCFEASAKNAAWLSTIAGAAMAIVVSAGLKQSKGLNGT